MKDRLALILREQNLTPKKLADLLGIQASTISHLLAGRNKPGFELISKIMKQFPEISPDWLILGAGAMYRDEKPSPPPFSPPATLFQELQPELSFIQKDEPLDRELISGRAIDVLQIDSTAGDDSHIAMPGESSKPRPQFSSAHHTMTIAEDSDIDRIVIFYKNHKFVSYLE